MELKQMFFEKVAETWDGGAPFPTLKEARRGSGDGLADFLRLELEEGVDWEAVQNRDGVTHEVMRLLGNAQADIARVAEAAIDFAVDGAERP